MSASSDHPTFRHLQLQSSELFKQATTPQEFSPSHSRHLCIFFFFLFLLITSPPRSFRFSHLSIMSAYCGKYKGMLPSALFYCFAHRARALSRSVRGSLFLRFFSFPMMHVQICLLFAVAYHWIQWYSRTGDRVREIHQICSGDCWFGCSAVRLLQFQGFGCSVKGLWTGSQIMFLAIMSYAR